MLENSESCSDVLRYQALDLKATLQAPYLCADCEITNLQWFCTLLKVADGHSLVWMFSVRAIPGYSHSVSNSVHTSRPEQLYISIVKDKMFV